MRRLKAAPAVVALAAVAAWCYLAAPAAALDRPWISDVYFYWYEWDYARRTGNWVNGVYNTPLFGYYDSRRLEDNIRELHCASEWGITHHFMDFWGYAWLDEKGRPRERCLMDAAEELRRRGYDIWMSYYQDGWDFQMDDFTKNLQPGRAVDGWLRNYAKSPAWPKIGGMPVQLVYGRNGVPKVTATDEGFREWLRDKYGSIERLRERWQRSDIRGWSDVRWNPGATGIQQADSILYQYWLWKRNWAEVNRQVRRKYGFPGMLASFDIGYGPFRGWGFSLQAKTFCGPHSYGGIFGQPHDADVERFIQAAVAKWYGKVFFDTFKNFYHDWEFRYPGFCYPPEPCHFDRFWTIALSHYAEALLHLSWNEWWEGSNLEPCREWGKTFCEKNLLYATVMKACFASIDRAQRSGQVAVLLNDWHWLVSGHHAADIYNTIQALRAASVDFKLLPDDFVTLDNLDDVRLVIAPTGMTGLGYNAKGQAIVDVLWRWLQGARERRLVIGYLPSADELPGECGQAMRDYLGLQAGKLVGVAAPKSINAFIDVGEEGDEEFVVGGRSNREDWSKLPDTAYGARKQRHTIRWCPGAGSVTHIMLPLAPGHEHLLTIAGDVIWPNRVVARMGGREIGRLELNPGYHEYQLTIPAEAATSPFANLTLTFETQRVPNVETKGKNKDRRVCNWAIDWIHVRTPDQPAERRVPAKPPSARLTFLGALAGLKPRELNVRSWAPVTADGAKVLSRYEPAGLARDMLLYGGRVWYCHGCLGDIAEPEYWQRILRWAGVKRRWLVRGEGVIGACLSAGETTVLVAYNTDITNKPGVQLQPPKHDWPLAEARAISRDGVAFPDGDVDGGRDSFRYYGVYEFAFCPVRLYFVRPARRPLPVTRWPAVVPGMTGRLPVRLMNITDKPVRGTLALESFLPSLTAKPVRFALKPHEAATVELAVTARDDADWGRKTVCLVVEVGGRRAWFWRPMYVAVEPKFTAALRPLGNAYALEISAAEPEPWQFYPLVEDMAVAVDGKAVGSIRPAPGQLALMPITLSRKQVGQRDQIPIELSYTVLGVRRTQRLTVAVPEPGGPAVTAPPDAERALVVRGSKCPVPQVIRLSGFHLPSGEWEVRDAQGRRGVIGKWVTKTGSNVVFEGAWVILPLGSSGPLFIYRTENPPTDLRVEKLSGGRLVVRNSELRAVIDPAKGGTVTELRWRAGRNVADRSFGASWGRWGKYDPLRPRTRADKFLGQERKHYQWEAPAKVAVVDRSPAHVTILVEQQRPQFAVRQRYTFWARVPYFHVTSSVQARSDVDLRELGIDEIVPLDVRLRRGPWTKIYPNFTGRRFGDKPRFHDGWREGPCLPPVATVMDHRTSLSLLTDQRWLGGRCPWSFRQGFFPARRNRPGIPDRAWLEVVRRCGPTIDAPWAKWPKPRMRKGETVSVSATVLLHDGSQAFAEDVAAAGVFVEAVEARIAKRTSQAPRRSRADWWRDDYDVRAQVTTPLGEQGLAVDWPLRVASKWIDLASICAVWQGADGPQVLQAAATVTASATARVSIQPPEIKLGSGRLYLYGRLTDEPPARPEELEAGVPNPSFENGRQGWSFAGAVLDTTVAHTGKASVRLQARNAKGSYAVISTDRVAVVPEAKHRLIFWAKTSTPGATVITNFYLNARYDFEHVRVPLKADGRWHRYEAIVPAGRFPDVAHPALRLWVYYHPGPVWIDDVSLKPLEALRPAASVGPIERR